MPADGGEKVQYNQVATLSEKASLHMYLFWLALMKPAHKFVRFQKALMDRVPVNDTIIYALARLVDDAQKERRDPSHSDIEFQIQRAGLDAVDTKKLGPPVGKAKRVRAVLSWALDNDPDKAEALSAGIISAVKNCGGF